MAIVKMNKIAIAGLIKDKPAIIRSLMRSGVVEITDLTSQEDYSGINEKFLSNLDTEEQYLVGVLEKLSSLSSAISRLSSFDTGKKPLFRKKRPVDKSTLRKVLSNAEDLLNFSSLVDKCEDDLDALKIEENKNNIHIAVFSPWIKTDIPIEQTGTKDTLFIFGTIPSKTDYDISLSEISASGYGAITEIINENKNNLEIFGVVHKSCEDEVLTILKDKGFQRVIFKEGAGTPLQIIDAAKTALLSVESEKLRIKNNLESLYIYKNEFETLYDYFCIEKDRLKTSFKMTGTEKTFLLEGWIPSEETIKVTDILKSEWICYVEFSTPGVDENYPIEFRNNSLVQPFEVITEMYSLPKSGILDPNIFIAPFFFIFFGLMVSDAGYGLVMAAATGFVLLKFKPSGMVYKLFKLIFLGSISTFIWGVLFGGWFGDLIQVITQGKYSIPPLWFNPLDDPMRLLLWSFIFGTLQLFLGMGLKGYILIKKGQIINAIFDVGFWYIFLIGLILLIAGGNIGKIGSYMSITGAILLVLSQGRSKKGILKKFFSGVLSLYNAVGFLSDVLSYSRLLALGLATGVIASVINTMGTLLGFNVVGIIVLIIVFIGGTIFNILINVLGAFVHSCRLHYVEFFGKFYEGGGKAFSPLKENTVYSTFN
ncbi:MAG: V-type ATP synthase subunit I [Ignavibacteria bacterium]|nr:V-type ATP synthase subunit I [Ignavibacteria bacterium]